MKEGIIQSVEGPNRTKRWKKNKFALCLRWDITFYCPWTSAFLVLRLWDSDWGLLPAFLGLRLADGREWDFSASITT